MIEQHPISDSLSDDLELHGILTFPFTLIQSAYCAKNMDDPLISTHAELTFEFSDQQL